MADTPVIKPAELDVELMKKLYEFGGLLSYKVMYFDTVSFSIRQAGEMTFNEDSAKALADSLIRNGFKVEIFSQMVHFNGAWNKFENNS